jgi:hypothetical protein
LNPTQGTDRTTPQVLNPRAWRPPELPVPFLSDISRKLLGSIVDVGNVTDLIYKTINPPELLWRVRTMPGRSSSLPWITNPPAG